MSAVNLREKICLVIHENDFNIHFTLSQTVSTLIDFLLDKNADIYIGLIYESGMPSSRLFDEYKDRGLKLYPIRIIHDFDVPYHRKVSFQICDALSNADFDKVIFYDTNGYAYYSTIAKKCGSGFFNTSFFIIPLASIKYEKFRLQEFFSVKYEFEQSYLEDESLHGISNIIAIMSKYCSTVYNYNKSLPIIEANSRVSDRNGKTEINVLIDIDSRSLQQIASFIKLSEKYEIKSLTIRVDKESLSNIDDSMFNDNTIIDNNKSVNPVSLLPNSPTSFYISVEKVTRFNRDLLNKTDISCCFIEQNCESDHVSTISQAIDRGIINYLNVIDSAADYIVEAKPNDRVEIVADIDKRVSVCMTHFNRPKMLALALDSIRNQTYGNYEVVITDDGSTNAEALEYLNSLEDEFNSRGWKILRQENKYLGAARNNSFRHSSGEYILFMDDDNIANSNMIERFVSAAVHSNADIVSSGSKKFTTDRDDSIDKKLYGYYIPLGQSISLGLMENCFGDANCIIKRDVFKDIGGFTEEYGLGYEDWEFFIKATLKGYKIIPLPEYLYWYRVNPQSMVNTTSMYFNQQRVFRCFYETLGLDLRPFLDYSFYKTMHKSTKTQRNDEMVDNAYNIANKFFPIGSQRRTYLKRLVRWVSRKSK